MGLRKGKNIAWEEVVSFFLLNGVSSEPFSWKQMARRWAAVYKELKARFKDLTFTGEMIVGYTKDGKPFNKVKNIRVIEEQKRNNLGTTKEQFVDMSF